jgi:hypothetical protein
MIAAVFIAATGTWYFFERRRAKYYEELSEKIRVGEFSLKDK